MTKALPLLIIILVALRAGALAQTFPSSDPNIFADFQCPEGEPSETKRSIMIDNYLSWAKQNHSAWTSGELLTNYIQHLAVKTCTSSAKSAITSYMPEGFLGSWSSSSKKIDKCTDDRESVERVRGDLIEDAEGECRSISTQHLTTLDSFKVSMLCKTIWGEFSAKTEFWNKREFDGSDLFVQRGSEDTYINASRPCDSTPTEAFDCSRPTRPEDVMTCGNPRLNELAALASKAYSRAKKTAALAQVSDLLSDASAYIDGQRQCGGDTVCLTKIYVKAIDLLANYGSDVSIPNTFSAFDLIKTLPQEIFGMPANAGDCVLTRVAAVSGRLVGDENFATGTAVSFVNGGYQVSYSKVPAVIESTKGDTALVCLIETPKHCPPGDNRGKKYLTTNLRTQKSWSLSDSQHSCGGQ